MILLRSPVDHTAAECRPAATVPESAVAELAAMPSSV